MSGGLSVAASIAGLTSLASEAVKVSFRFAHAVGDAQSETTSLTSQISGLYGALCAVHLVALQLDEDGLGPQAFKVEQVLSCQELLENIQQELLEYNEAYVSSDVMERTKQRFAWPLSSTKIKSWVHELREQKTTLNLALSADNMSNLLRCLSKQENIANDIKELREEMRSARAEEIESKISAKRVEILDALEVDARIEIFLMSRDVRCPGTGNWLLQSSQYQTWHSGPSSILWLWGIPGAGKTVLASMVISEIESTININQGLAYFHCSYKTPETQSPARILGCLAKQLAMQNGQALQDLDPFFDRFAPYINRLEMVPTGAMKDLLKTICNRFDNVLLVIDGLDECDTHTSDMLDFLCDVYVADRRNVRLLILSRGEQQIRQVLMNHPSMSIAAKNADLRLYVQAQVGEHRRKGDLQIRDNNLEAEICKRLVAKADGMFRWVVCQIEWLCELTSDSALRAALDALPPTLEETYKRILQRITNRGPKVRTMVQRVLRCINWSSSCADSTTAEVRTVLSMPLSIAAIQEVISLEEGSTQLDSAQMPLEEVIFRWCGSLVRKSKDNTLVFAHFTVKEYLASAQLKDDPSLGGFHLSMDFQEIVAESFLTSLQYCLLTNFVTDRPVQSLTTDGTLKSRTLRDDPYAFRLRAVVILLIETPYDLFGIRDEIAHLMMQLLTGPTFSSWAQYFWIYLHVGFWSYGSEPEKALSQHFDPELSPLHYAAMLRSRRLCTLLAERGYNLDAKSESGTPLVCATCRGFAIAGKAFNGNMPLFGIERDGQVLEHRTKRFQTVASLIESGADVNDPNAFGKLSVLDMMIELSDWWCAATLLQAGAIVSRRQIARILHSRGKGYGRLLGQTGNEFAAILNSIQLDSIGKDVRFRFCVLHIQSRLGELLEHLNDDDLVFSTVKSIMVNHGVM